jgi:hypothetical protein
MNGKITDDEKVLTEDVMDERRPSEPKYCAMNSVIISPAPSRQSSADVGKSMSLA